LITRVYVFMRRFWIYTIALWDYLESVPLTTTPCEAWISGWRKPISSFYSIYLRHRKWSSHISYRR